MGPKQRTFLGGASMDGVTVLGRGHIELELGGCLYCPPARTCSGCHQGVLFRWAQQTGAIGSGFAKHQEINDDWPQV